MIGLRKAGNLVGGAGEKEQLPLQRAKPKLGLVDHPMVLEDGNFWKLVEAYDASQEAARQKEATGGEKTQLTVSPSSLAILQSLKKCYQAV